MTIFFAQEKAQIGLEYYLCNFKIKTLLQYVIQDSSLRH